MDSIQRVGISSFPLPVCLDCFQNHSPSRQRSIWLIHRRYLCPPSFRVNVHLWWVRRLSPTFPQITSPPKAPIAWPIAKLLDNVLGANEQHTYKKAELKSFLQFHRTGEEPLRDDEIAILNGVLELNNKRVGQIMTPLKVRSLSHGACHFPTCVILRTRSYSVPIPSLTIPPWMPCKF